MLTLLLLDISQGVIEELTIGDAYTSGHFEALKVSPRSVSFRFIGDTTWTVKVSASPALKLPFSDPRGVSRPMRLRKTLIYSLTPRQPRLMVADRETRSPFSISAEQAIRQQTKRHWYTFRYTSQN